METFAGLATIVFIILVLWVINAIFGEDDNDKNDPYDGNGLV